MLTQKLKEARDKEASAVNTIREHRSKMEAGTWKAETDQAAFDAAKTALDEAKVEIRNLETAIATGPAPAPEQRAAAPVTVNVIGNGGRGDTENTLANNFSLLRAVNQIVTHGKLSGAEAEVHQEAEKEARSAGIAATTAGQIRLPGFIARHNTPEQRTQTVGSATSAGAMVQADLSPNIVPFLNPNPICRQMGATYLPGLIGDYDETRETSNFTATWPGEIGSATSSDSNRDKINYRAKRVTAQTKLSRLSLIQTSGAIESRERMKLSNAIDRALDRAIINGAGGTVPTGILTLLGAIGGTPNIISLGTNGAVPAWANIVALETLVASFDANMGSLGYISTPGLAGLMKNTKRDVAGNGFIWEGRNGSGEMNGYKSMVSTHVPSNLTKGTANAICHAIIYGNWEEAVIGQWGGLDIIVNPFSGDTEAEIRLTVHSYMDVEIRHANSFAAIIDAKLS